MEAGPQRKETCDGASGTFDEEDVAADLCVASEARSKTDTQTFSHNGRILYFSFWGSNRKSSWHGFRIGLAGIILIDLWNVLCSDRGPLGQRKPIHSLVAAAGFVWALVPVVLHAGVGEGRRASNALRPGSIITWRSRNPSLRH